MRRYILFLILILFLFISLYFPFPVSAAKVTLNEWKDINVPPGNDIEFTLDNGDFPAGSNFVGSGSANIRFYLGKKKPRDNVLGDFFSYSGAQAFWDIQPYHLNTWNSDYQQNLSGEQILDRHLEMIKNVGVKWVRFDWIWGRIYTWDLLDGQGNSLCTNDAAYKYLETDLIFKLAKKHNIKILADLSVTPRKISVVSPFAQWIQIDMSDNTLDVADTPTFFSFLKRQTDNFFEAHLMAPKPETYVKHLVHAGFKRIIAPVECQDPREFLSEGRVYECEIGLAIDVETPLETGEPFLEELDFILVMTAGAGASGQLFEESTLSKIHAIKRNLPDLPIEVEGGMNQESVKLVVEAGATRIVSASYIFQEEKKVKDVIKQLETAATIAKIV